MSSFDLLQRDIKKYIYDEGWQSLRPIQEAAIKHVHQTDHNLILAAPTASGKTEAAFLPAINSVNDWSTGLKIIYISPLIALINDQFKRIVDLCSYIDVPVTSWHGEASRTGKNKLLKEPKGILLITPESIEAMLSLRPGEAIGLFNGVEWIIVDEIHSFSDNNRGVQLRALTERMKVYMNQDPRFIGMSATLNKEDYKDIKNFFISHRTTDVLLDRSKNPLESTKNYYPENIKGESGEALDEIYQYSIKESMLVFPNARSEVERLAVGLNRLKEKKGSHARYFAHHSSISKEVRLTAEEFAKGSRGELFTICCTSTLELGIDIGSVDSIVQYNAPYSVASLGQRLGRSGRTTGKNILHFIATNEWSLLQGLAALSLYEEGALDRVEPIIKPYDVVAHQMLSMLLEHAGMPYEELNQLNKNFRCWEGIEDEDYQELIEYLIENNYIEILENDAITGLATEKLLRGAEFFAQFETEGNFSVYSNEKKIGEIPLAPSVQIGVNIYLSARIWKIKDIELKTKKIYVIKAVDGNPPMYFGDGGDVTNEIRIRMKNILEDERYWIDYNENIRDVLWKLSRDNLRDHSTCYASPCKKLSFLECAKECTIIGYSGLNWIAKGDKIGLRTFQGTKINRTLQLILNMISEDGKYTLEDNETLISGPNIKKLIGRIRECDFAKEDIYVYLRNKPELVEVYLSSNKYRKLVPDHLNIKYIINNRLDLEGVRKYLVGQNSYPFVPLSL